MERSTMQTQPTYTKTADTQASHYKARRNELRAPAAQAPACPALCPAVGPHTIQVGPRPSFSPEGLGAHLGVHGWVPYALFFSMTF